MMLAACGADDRDKEPATPSAPTYIDPALVPRIQQAVTTACLCTRSKGFNNEASCWAEVRATIARYRHDLGADSACAAGSSSTLTFDRKGQPAPDDTTVVHRTNGPNMTITTMFPYGACTWDEVPARKAEYQRDTGMKGCG
jgi:hypothetical protein